MFGLFANHSQSEASLSWPAAAVWIAVISLIGFIVWVNNRKL